MSLDEKLVGVVQELTAIRGILVQILEELQMHTAELRRSSSEAGVPTTATNENASLLPEPYRDMTALQFIGELYAAGDLPKRSYTRLQYAIEDSQKERGAVFYDVEFYRERGMPHGIMTLLDLITAIRRDYLIRKPNLGSKSINPVMVKLRDKGLMT